MIKNKKEVGIPLSKVETFDYDFEKQVLTISFDSKNSIWFNDIPEKIYSKFKVAMSDEASLFLISQTPFIEQLYSLHEFETISVLSYNK